MGKQIVLESTRNGICSVDNSLSEDTLRTVWDFILILAIFQFKVKLQIGPTV